MLVVKGWMDEWMGVPADGEERGRVAWTWKDGKSIRLGQGTGKSSVGTNQLEGKGGLTKK